MSLKRIEHPERPPGIHTGPCPVTQAFHPRPTSNRGTQRKPTMHLADSRPAILPMALLVLLLTLGACAGDGAATATGALDGGDVDLAWTTEEAYAIGGYEAIEWDAFGNVGGVGFDDAGNLYVLDTQASQIRVVGLDGQLVRSFGRQGEGPGELNRPDELVVLPDGRVAVYDFGKFGWVTYDADGEWIEDIMAPDPGNVQLLGNFSVAGDDAVIARVVGQIRMTEGPGSDSESESEPEEEGEPIVKLSLSQGAESQTVFRAWEPPEPEGPESEFSSESSGNVMQIRMSQLVAFEPGVRFAGLPDGGFAVLDSTTYRVEVFDAVGAPVGVIERPIAPTPVTDAIREAEQGRQMAEVEEREASGDETGGLRILGGGGIRNADMSGMNQMMRERVENMAFYPEIPVVEQLAADHEGRIWVQRSSGQPGEPGPTDIVLPDQTYVGTLPADGIRIPSAFGPNGLAAWIETDEFDAERIVVKRIRPSGTN